MKTTTPLEIRDNRQLRALTGLSDEQFEKLENKFEEVYEEKQKQNYEEALNRGERQRERGGGRKGKLATIGDKLLFILYYLKVYPTFDVLGSIFKMARSKAWKNVHKLWPILQETLSRLGVLPQRHFENVEEFKKACEGIDKIIIDVTEREHERPQDDEKQGEMFSGKQKDHTVKNTIISTLSKVILFIGVTFSGHNHDYSMLKEEFPTEESWFKELEVFVDLGYQGIQTDYEGEQIKIPYKKPRKSKSNPAPKLTEEEKIYNRALSKIRVYVENAIGGMKRYNILSHPFRNKKEGFVDNVMSLCGGLWNIVAMSNS